MDATKRQANVSTGKLYKKDHEKVLRAAGFQSVEWGTKNQWAEAARKVKAGAKAVEIEYCNKNGRSWSVYLFNGDQTEPISRKITGTEEFLKQELHQAREEAKYWERKAIEAQAQVKELTDTLEAVTEYRKAA